MCGFVPDRRWVNPRGRVRATVRGFLLTNVLAVMWDVGRDKQRLLMPFRMSGQHKLWKIENSVCCVGWCRLLQYFQST